MLLDRARFAVPRSTSDALIFGLICFLKAVVIALAICVAALLVSLVAAIIYFVCKIPGVGPILLFFVHPLLVVAAGVFGFLISVFAALAAPALWDGDTVTQAIAKTIAVLKERAVLSVLYLLVMGIVAGIILSILMAVILPGYLSMTGLATGIIGQKLAGGVSLLNNLPFALMYLGSGESGHMTASAGGCRTSQTSSAAGKNFSASTDDHDGVELSELSSHHLARRRVLRELRT
jgi:hypothetical protein